LATVDLRTFDIAYHDGGGRSLTARRKEISGTERAARWLGNGTLAVAGTDFHGAYDGQPMGLRLIDTRDWSSQDVDPQLGGVGAAGGLLYGAVTTAGHQQWAVYGLDGAVRYRLNLEPDTYLSLQGPDAYVCRSVRSAPRPRLGDQCNAARGLEQAAPRLRQPPVRPELAGLILV
jgi:hypothetical protein